MTERADSMRFLRGGLLATCCLLLGISGHVLGGGAAPAAAPTLVAAVLIGGAAVAWAGRRRTFRQLAAAAAVAQAAFHVALSLDPAHASGHGLDARMLGGHAVATLVMTAVLAYGEAALAALGRTLHRPAVPHGPRPSVPPRRRPAYTAVVPDAGLRIVRQRPRRGPPLGVAA